MRNWASHNERMHVQPASGRYWREIGGIKFYT